MATGGMIGNGTKIAYSVTSPLSWVRIGQVLSAPPLGITREKIDSTVHGSAIYNRAMPGMADIEDLAMTLLADLNQTTSAAHEAMRTYLVAGTTLWFRVEVPTDRTQSAFRAFEFQAWVQTWRANASDPKGRQELEVVLAFDGDSYTVYNSGASAIS